ARSTALWPPAMIACTRSGPVPKVGGISADSSTPRRPLVPAPTKITRPALRSACVTISTPTAIRSFSRWPAASILRSSWSMRSTVSAADSLSIASVEGLICSVGSDCHFERTGMLRRPQTPAAAEHAGPFAERTMAPLSAVNTNHKYYHKAPMIDAYLDHLRVERRLADHTLESYGRDLQALAAFAAGAGRQIERLDRPALEQFVREQMTRGLSPRSVARMVASVRGLYRFLGLGRRLEHNPADDLQSPRAWPALPRFLSIEEVDRLIAQPDVATPLGLRDRAMIELLYATGLRVSELVNVRVADLHLDQQFMTCIGKGNKERLVPIGEQAADWITRYQRTARPVLLKKRGASPRLFLNARGRPLTRVGFWKILKQYGGKAN